MGSRVGPLKPTPAHSQMSLRDGINVRLRGGIQIPAAVQAFGPNWCKEQVEGGSRL